MDLIRLAEITGVPVHAAALVARAITRLVFAVGTSAMDQPRARDPQLIDELTTTVKMIVVGARDARRQREKNRRSCAAPAPMCRQRCSYWAPQVGACDQKTQSLHRPELTL